MLFCIVLILPTPMDCPEQISHSNLYSVEELDGEMLVVARLLFHFLELLQFNTHEVAQLEMRGRRCSYDFM